MNCGRGLTVLDVRSLVLLATVAVGCATPRGVSPGDGGALRLRTPLDLRYKVAGEGPTTLVLLHGSFDRLETWDAVTPRLARTFRVVALDLLGFGETRNPLGAYQPDALADGVVLALDGLGVQRAVIVGNSLGGAVAARFAARFPERTEALVFEDASLYEGSTGLEAGRALAAALQRAQAVGRAPSDVQARLELRAAVAAVLRAVLKTPGVVSEALVDHFTAGFLPPRFDAAGKAGFDREAAPEASNARATTRFPVLAVWGMEDPLEKVSDAEDRLSEGFPDAKLVLLGGCGHVPHLERPEDFADILEKAFAPGGALPADDVFLPAPGAKPPSRLPPTRSSRAWLAAYADQPEVLAELAFVLLARGDLPGAERAAARIGGEVSAQARAVKAMVQGALREQRGEAGAVEAYLEALGGLRPRSEGMLLEQLVRYPLTGEEGQRVDAALARSPVGAANDLLRYVARLDRKLSLERYEEALKEFEMLEAILVEIPAHQALVQLRKSWTLLKLGRLQEAQQVAEIASRMSRGGGPSTACFHTVDRRIARAEGRPVAAEEACDQAKFPPALGVSPPALAALSPLFAPLNATPGSPGRAEEVASRSQGLQPVARTPSGAVALARFALEQGRVEQALLALKAVPDFATVQMPEFHRLRLALEASAGNAKALDEARAFVLADDSEPWRRVLLTTLHAAGRHAEAQAGLWELAFRTGRAATPELLQELAYGEASLGNLERARQLLGNLQAERWGDPSFEDLPHIVKARDRLKAAR
ncbi:MAG: alpha/beta hydrolase [Deltaproteobacteria bacterium]|nr:alpha/beta hydrolase [Deltaproteobacteria bacterium]